MATAEELCESEVLWPEAPIGDEAAGTAPPGCSPSPVAPRRSRTPDRRRVPGKARHQGSRPVDIPRPARPARRGGDDEDHDGGGRSASGTVVPPHVLVSRRRPEGAFALRSGPGRARELSHLRDSVLRMTGFIEG